MRQARCAVLRGLNLCLLLILFLLDSNAALARPVAPALDICNGLTTNQDRISVRPVARPPFLKAFREPAFATRSMRITNSSPGTVIKPAGKPAQAWNSDETLLLLHRYDKTHKVVLHDGVDYQEIGVLDVPVTESEDLFWSRNHPDLIYTVAQTGPLKGRLLEYNVSSEAAKTLKDFTPICARAGLSVDGGQLARPSGDDDLFTYRCGTPSDANLVLSYRRSTDAVSTLPIGGNTPWPPDAVPQPTISGQYIWFAGEILDQSLAATGKQLDMADPMQAVSIGQNREQEDALYQSPASASPRSCDNDGWRGLGLVVEHVFTNESCRSVVSQSDGYPEASDVEIFASAHVRPEWLAMSNVGYENFDAFTSRRQAPLLFSEILIMNTTPDNEEVCRLAHHRSYGTRASNGGYPPHLGEPNVTQSPSGTRVLFSTDWYDSGFVDTYVIELPAYTPHDLAGRWVDVNNKNVVTEFSQVGEKFSFQRIVNAQDAGNRIQTLGSGIIAGNRLEVTYTILLGDDREISGECSGEVLTELDQVSLQCSDHYFARQAFTLRRP